MFNSFHIISSILATFAFFHSAYANPLPNFFDTIQHSTALGYVKQTFGKGMGNVSSYSTIGTFWYRPVLEPATVIPFIDARAHSLYKGQWASNLSVGGRYIDSSLQHVFGAYTSYDRRDQYSGAQQIGIGLEWMHIDYAVRLNGYLPISHQRINKRSSEFNYLGGYQASCREFRKALKGLDAEVELNLDGILPPLAPPLYANVGYYYYQFEKGCKPIQGGRLRLETGYFNGLKLGAISTYDSTFKWKLQGIISLSFTFGPQHMVYAQQSDFVDIAGVAFKPLQRQEIILQSKKCCSWQTNW